MTDHGESYPGERDALIEKENEEFWQYFIEWLAVVHPGREPTAEAFQYWVDPGNCQLASEVKAGAPVRGDIDRRTADEPC